MFPYELRFAQRTARIQGMIHYTLNTNTIIESSRTEIAEGVIAVCQTLLEPGQYAMPVPQLSDYIINIRENGESGLLFSIEREGYTIAICAVADSKTSAEVMWIVMARAYVSLAEREHPAEDDFKPPIKPNSIPWLAVMLLGTTDETGAANWLGDFARCMAWAWVESRSESS